MRDSEIIYLEQVVIRSQERRTSWFGSLKTTKAEAAEMVLVAYVPALLQEIKRLRSLEKGS